MKKRICTFRMLQLVSFLALFSAAALAADQVQLIAAVGPGDTVRPSIANPDGSESPFKIPDGYAFVVTDISIQRLLLVSGPGLFGVDLVQNIPTGGTTNRWSFVGSITQNAERGFTTGMKFTASFWVDNASSSVDSVNVRLCGFFEKLGQ